MYVALSDSGSMKYSYILEQSPRDWETTMRTNLVPTIFHTLNVPMRGKLSELHCNVLLVFNRGEKVLKCRKTMGQICPIVFLDFLTFSPGLENKTPSKCGSESFPRTVTYILCVDNC